MRLIDADALGVGLCNPDVFENKGYANGWNTLIKILLDAPAADPVRHGRWVRLDTPIGEPDFKCTACNIRVHVPTCMGEPMYEFCPVCGAKMDEGEEDA